MGNTATKDSTSIEDVLEGFHNKIERLIVKEGVWNFVREDFEQNELSQGYKKMLETELAENIDDSQQLAKEYLLKMDRIFNQKPSENSDFVYMFVVLLEEEKTFYEICKSIIDAGLKFWKSRYGKGSECIELNTNRYSEAFINWILTEHLRKKNKHKLALDEDKMGWNKEEADWIEKTKTPGMMEYEDFLEFWTNSKQFNKLFKSALLWILTDMGKKLEIDIEDKTQVHEAEKGLIAPKKMIPFSFLKETRSTLIDVYSAYFLQAKLPAQSRVEWSCVYSSLVDGSSWNMLKKVIEKTGSLIILVSESMNLENVFGVYIDKELEKSSKWGGNNDNFLFILSKQEKTGLNKFASFRGSGINSNFQYYNYGTETLPNGVGFGGQLEYFGFWISASLNEGHSYPSATYSNSEPISPLNNFVPGIVEVFLVKKTTNHLFIDEFETDSDACNSAIKNNPEATAILELANKKLYSKDFAENQ